MIKCKGHEKTNGFVLRVDKGKLAALRNNYEQTAFRALRRPQTRKQCCGNIIAEANVSLFAASGNSFCGSLICFLVCAPRKHFGKQGFVVCVTTRATSPRAKNSVFAHVTVNMHTLSRCKAAVTF